MEIRKGPSTFHGHSLLCWSNKLSSAQLQMLTSFSQVKQKLHGILNLNNGLNQEVKLSNCCMSGAHSDESNIIKLWHGIKGHSFPFPNVRKETEAVLEE